MNEAKVFLTNLRTEPGINLLDKVERLAKAAGIEQIEMKDKFVAIKIHFGEPGNLAYLRPNYARRIVQLIQSLGGKPYLTDANTLYTGQRDNAVDHLTAAFENGYNPLVTGCPVIIADGLKGTDYREIPIDQKHCKTAKIGTAIADADVIISMNHFKGHEMTGFGGALKNLGMGSGSRGGKLEMHSASQPKIAAENCVACRQCMKQCSQRAITINPEHKAVINLEKCIGCGQCVAVCMYDAAQVQWDESALITNEKIAEYAYAVLKDKPSFHLNFIMDVSPNCDCWSNNDLPVVPDIGIAASLDPVALDRACVDLVNNAPIIMGSVLEEKGCQEHQDRFTTVHPTTDWRAGLRYAEAIGLGTQRYELVHVQ